MGKIALSSALSRRRVVISLAVLPIGLVLNHAAADDATILIVSRKRLLNDTDHARALLKAEIELTTELQRRVDAVKAELNAEEQELTELRSTLERSVFDERVADFDRKIRSQRREAQQYAANLQSAFRVERLKLVEALDPLLEKVRLEHRASVILNADQALALDPVLDITDEAIIRFNSDVPPPTIPDSVTISPGPGGVPLDDGQPQQ
jgi:Skp family chaperone for outer membrane proteins